MVEPQSKINQGFWYWYERFWKVWALAVALLSTLQFLRGKFIIELSFAGVMFTFIQVMCFVLSLLMLFEFGKGLDKKRRKIE